MLAVTITLAALSVLVVLQTGLSFVRSRAWWVRMFDFPRPQIALSSVVLLGVFAWSTGGFDAAERWELALFGLLALAVLVQVFEILPYTRFWKTQVPAAPGGIEAENRLRFVISNVRMQNRDSERWLRTVRAEDPDVIIAVEVDGWWHEKLAALKTEYPHHVGQPQDNTYGMAIYSRLPLGETQIKHLVETDVPSLFTSLTLRSGKLVRCVVLHPRPPRPDIQQDSRLRDAELVRAGQIVRSFRSPVIVAGDLNDVAWSHTTHLFQRMAGLLDPRIGRGLFATFSANHFYLRFPLDHVFLSKHFDLVTLRRLEHVGSDHFPIMIDLALRVDAEDRPEPPKADGDDEKEAIDAVEDVREMHEEETAEERRERKEADA